ncbi:hypothetical protein OIU34_09850 [Pararhizobium sp. BT-229]|uniref:hypothetical protein n=1 Tax=Pararhizobium sp. BT-229 TaxID=2986923 RepID=UPI0021F71CBF|nr:hypothetical protein [Pararhizobium sp. BT-229]MCV9962201.1 hypothetical protein [Pararhizobium sp. BT-229]
MMLPPTQQASATLTTSLVQSIVDDIEKRRLEEEEKAKGKKDEDKVLKARVTSDEVSQAANAKINEHFFGALKRDENPLATLVSRFTAVMGMSQGTDESDMDFGSRLEDALAMADLVTKTDVDGKPMVVGLDTFRVSVDDLTAAVDGTDENPTGMTGLLARFVVRNGLERAEGEDAADYKLRMRAALTEARAGMPSSVAEVEAKSGLRDLGITAREMIEAIKHPYGNTAQKIETILDDTAVEEKFLTADVSKVLQRLEEVADPKTIEELKAERLQKDPTRVEDAETRKEREESIRALEAGEKLEDVEDLHEVIRESNEAVIKGETGGKPSLDANSGALAIQTIQVLAAGVEIAEAQASIESSNANQVAASEKGAESTEVREAPSAEDQAVMLARAGQANEEQREEDAQKDIFAVGIDENGIYELLAKKEAA